MLRNEQFSSPVPCVTRTRFSGNIIFLLKTISLARLLTRISFVQIQLCALPADFVTGKSLWHYIWKYTGNDLFLLFLRIPVNRKIVSR